MKKRNILALSLCLVLVLGLSFVLAVNNSSSTNGSYNASYRPYIPHNVPNKTINNPQNKTLPNESDRNARRDFERNLNRGNNNSINNNSNKSLEKIRRENYGSCISNNTKIRNSCFKTEKESFKTCEKNVRNQTKTWDHSANITAKRQMRKQIKEMDKACKNEYKLGLKECRVTFNSTKMDCNVWRCNSNQTLINGSCLKK